MWSQILAKSLLALGLCASAATASSYDRHYQVFLHPSPKGSHEVAQTLTAEQAKSVLEHHLGGAQEHYGVEANDRKSRVVFVRGDMDVQGEEFGASRAVRNR